MWGPVVFIYIYPDHKTTHSPTEPPNVSFAHLPQAAALAVQEGVYLGITYQLFDPGNPASPTDPAGDTARTGPYANVFTLVQPDGAVGFRYAKRHPVPIVEADAVAGHARAPPHVETLWGRVGGAICFDMDFPLWAKEAGRARVALMLQPSWTWGPLGQLHAFDSAIRGVENGFAVFRCSSGAVLGLFWEGCVCMRGGVRMLFKLTTVLP